MSRTGARVFWRVALGLAVLSTAGAIGIALAWQKLHSGPVAQGVAAYERGDWGMAVALAGARLKIAPNDLDAMRLSARSAVRLRRDGAARSLYARLGGRLALEPEDYYLLGTAIDRAGDHDLARECWATGLMAAPDHPELLREFVRLSLKSEQLDRASLLASKLATRPGWEVRGGLLLGEIEYRRENPSGAAEALRRALDRDPTARDAPKPPTEYRKLLAKALLKTERPAEAGDQLKMVLAAAPDPEASWLLSRSYLQAGDTAQASAMWKQGGPYRDEHPILPEPAPFVGSSRCAECHKSIHNSEQNGLHSRTFQRGSDFHGLPIPDQPVSDPARAEVQHTIARAEGGLKYSTRVNDETNAAIVDYVFGSGNHAQTLVGHDGTGQSREFRLSHYDDNSAWEVTTGHPRNPSPHEGYLGRFLSNDDADSCLFCHTTVARSARLRQGPESIDRGIGCERCHGPAGNHLKAVAVRFADPAIARPRLAKASQVVALCGQCHSPFGKEVTRAEPAAVRFPATGLTWSRCYLESGGKLDCRTCHDPHRDAEKSEAFYETRCLTCHAPPTLATDSPRDKPVLDRRPCPVSPARGCVSCHMPAVKNLAPHTNFTDHYIRVHARSGNAVATGKPHGPP